MSYYRIYTDGSYQDGSGETHGGIVIDGEHSYKVHIVSHDPRFVSMRNVGGEILASWFAFYLAIESLKKNGIGEELQHHTIEIVYDYIGVGAWLTGAWRCNKEGTQWYREQVLKLVNDIGCVKPVLTHVKGHSDNIGNNMADHVAAFDLSYVNEHNIPIIDIDDLIQKVC